MSATHASCRTFHRPPGFRVPLRRCVGVRERPALRQRCKCPNEGEGVQECRQPAFSISRRRPDAIEWCWPFEASSKLSQSIPLTYRCGARRLCEAGHSCSVKGHIGKRAWRIARHMHKMCGAIDGAVTEAAKEFPHVGLVLCT